MNDNAVRKSACGREMGNYEFSWSVLKVIIVAQDVFRMVVRGVIFGSGCYNCPDPYL